MRSLDEYLAKLGNLSLQRLSAYQTIVAYERQKAKRTGEFRKQQLKIEKEKWAIKQEHLEHQKRIDQNAKEECILAFEQFTCNPAQRAYYKELKQQIMFKVQVDMSNIE